MKRSKKAIRQQNLEFVRKYLERRQGAFKDYDILMLKFMKSEKRQSIVTGHHNTHEI